MNRKIKQRRSATGRLVILAGVMSAVAFVLLGPAPLAGTAAERPPNVVVVLVDDLRDDPYELTNVIGRAETQAVRRQLDAELDALLKDGP